MSSGIKVVPLVKKENTKETKIQLKTVERLSILSDKRVKFPIFKNIRRKTSTTFKRKAKRKEPAIFKKRKGVGFIFFKKETKKVKRRVK